MQVIICSMSKLQGPTVQHRNYIQYPVIKHHEKGHKNKAYITESLHYIAEIDTTL